MIYGLYCHAGAYMKLLQKEAVSDLTKFDNTARYTIMFGEFLRVIYLRFI